MAHRKTCADRDRIVGKAENDPRDNCGYNDDNQTCQVSDTASNPNGMKLYYWDFTSAMLEARGKCMDTIRTKMFSSSLQSVRICRVHVFSSLMLIL